MNTQTPVNEQLGESLYIEIHHALIRYCGYESFDPWYLVDGVDKEVYKEAASNFLGKYAQAV